MQTVFSVFYWVYGIETNYLRGYMVTKKTVTNNDNDAVTPAVGTRSKGTANAEAGQIELSTALTTGVVFGASNLKAIYMKKKTATGYEFETVDFAKIGAMIALGYKLVSVSSTKNRTFDLTAATGLSKKLYVKVDATVTIGFSQSNKVYTRVTQAARDFFGQTAAPATPKEVVFGGNYFAFPTDWNGIPKGTLLSRNALKATVRYAEPTDTNSGVYRSYAKETPGPVV